MTETVDTAADDTVTSDVDVDEARQVGVAVPPASKDEYLEASQQLQPGFVGTVDATDPSIGWTSQHLIGDREMGEGEKADVKAFVDPTDDTPGQVYLPEQLPDPQAAIAAGLAPVKIPEHLITEDEDHIQGLEPIERLGREHRAALRRAVVKHRRHQSGADGESDDVATPVVNRRESAESDNSSSGAPGGLSARSTPAAPKP